MMSFMSTETAIFFLVATGALAKQNLKGQGERWGVSERRERESGRMEEWGLGRRGVGGKRNNVCVCVSVREKEREKGGGGGGVIKVRE